MRPLLLCVPVLALALALAPPALAKGPLEASLEGPGLEAPLQFGGWTDPGATEDPGRAPLGRLAEAAGFFPASFGQSTVGPILAKRPKGDLGPRYTLTYGLGGPEGDEERIVQDVYPYARPHPVTYMAPGQPFYETMRTRGGWFVATSPNAPPLDYILRDAGLPRHPPAEFNPATVPWTLVEWSALGASLLLGALVGVLLVRRRGGERRDLVPTRAR